MSEVMDYKSRLSDPASRKFETFSYLPAMSKEDIKKQIEYLVSKGRAPTSADASAAVAAPEFTLRCDLGVGAGGSWVVTNDLTHGSVDENMGTS